MEIIHDGVLDTLEKDAMEPTTKENTSKKLKNKNLQQLKKRFVYK